MIDKVLAMAAQLGKTEESEELRALCQAAVDELTGQLKPGVTADGCGAAFVLAAAWIALALRVGSAADGGVERFTAGAVTIRRGDARLRSEALRLQARQVMKPYLRDEGFSFRGVTG